MQHEENWVEEVVSKKSKHFAGYYPGNGMSQHPVLRGEASSGNQISDWDFRFVAVCRCQIRQSIQENLCRNIILSVENCSSEYGNNEQKLQNMNPMEYHYMLQ